MKFLIFWVQLLLLSATEFSGATTEAWIPSSSIQTKTCSGLMTSSLVKQERDFAIGLAADAAPASSTSTKIEVIGKGRIGSLFEGEDTIFVGRDDSIDPNGSGPILLATRNDALNGIVEKCPPNRRKDLVFMQNGYLDNFLAAENLLSNTQVLLYLSVPKLGVEPVDGVTAVNPEGLTAATGIHAQAFADRLACLNLKCNVVTPEEYRPAMFEKLM